MKKIKEIIKTELENSEDIENNKEHRSEMERIYGKEIPMEKYLSKKEKAKSVGIGFINGFYNALGIAIIPSKVRSKRNSLESKINPSEKRLKHTNINPFLQKDLSTKGFCEAMETYNKRHNERTKPGNWSGVEYERIQKTKLGRKIGALTSAITQIGIGIYSPEIMGMTYLLTNSISGFYENKK